MCYIVVANRKLTSGELEQVRRHALFNRDGAGYAVYRDGKLVIRKGLWNNAIVSETMAVLGESGRFWRVAHFRTATSGSVHPSLAHPFRTRRGAFAFNGHIEENICIAMALVLASRGVQLTHPISDASLMAGLISSIGWSAVVPVVESGGRGVLLTPKGPKFAGRWHTESEGVITSAPLSVPQYHYWRDDDGPDCLECNSVSLCDICNDMEFASLDIWTSGSRLFRRKCDNQKCRVGGHSPADICADIGYCIITGDEFAEGEEDDGDARPYQTGTVACGMEDDCSRIRICDECINDRRAVRKLAAIQTSLRYQRCQSHGTYCQFLDQTLLDVCSKQTGAAVCPLAYLGATGASSDDRD